MVGKRPARKRCKTFILTTNDSMFVVCHMLKISENFYMLQVIVDVMAGFKPKPDTRDIRSFLC